MRSHALTPKSGVIPRELRAVMIKNFPVGNPPGWAIFRYASRRKPKANYPLFCRLFCSGMMHNSKYLPSNNKF